MASDEEIRLTELYDLSDDILQSLGDKTSKPIEAMEIIAFMAAGLWETQFREEGIEWPMYLQWMHQKICQRQHELRKAVKEGTITYELLGKVRPQ